MNTHAGSSVIGASAWSLVLAIVCSAACSSGSGAAGNAGASGAAGTTPGGGGSSGNGGTASGGAGGSGGASPVCTPGLPSGFAATPKPFALPAARCNTPFDRLGDSISGGADFELLDLDTDERPDIVVYRDECDSAIGTTKWDVYAAGPSGFSAAPQAFALPAPRCNTPFDRLGDAISGGADFALLDLSADERSDIVVHRDACDAAIGAERWDVHVAGPSGFAPTPQGFAVPAPRCGTPFDRLGDSTTGGANFQLLDLSADGKPDIVVHRDACDAQIGSQRWDVHVAGPAGFSATPAPFTLPAPRCNTSFDSLGDAVSGGIDFTLLDLTADSRPDLVVHRDTCDAAIGAERWDVYVAGPSGFSTTPEPFALPAPRCNTSFDRLGDNASGGIDFSLLDLSCDARPDIVVFRDACDSGIGSERWDVYVAGAQGFEPAPSPFTIPAARCNTTFDRLAELASDKLGFGLLTLVTGARPDIVVYRDPCESAIGTTRWDAYSPE